MNVYRKLGSCLRLGVFFLLACLAFAATAESPKSGVKLGVSAKSPPPMIDGFWQTNGSPRTVFIFGENFQPPGATSPLVKIGGKPSLFANVITNGLIIAVLLPQQPAMGPVSVETRSLGMPPKTIARATSATKLGANAKGTTISGIWPHQASAGSFVYIFGSGYARNKTRVTINETPVPLIQVVDQNLIVAVVPAGAASGVISAQTGGGQAKSKTAFRIL